MAENLRNLGVEECDLFLIGIHNGGQFEQPK
jgi:hypothetical protein